MTTVENPPVNGDTGAPTIAAGNPIGFGHRWHRPRRVRTRHSVRERAEGLRRDRAPFVHAQVVLAERPTSAKPGDEALVLVDGIIEAFVEPVMPGAGNRRAFAADPADPAAYAAGAGISSERDPSPQIHGYIPCPTPDMRDTS